MVTCGAEGRTDARTRDNDRGGGHAASAACRWSRSSSSIAVIIPVILAATLGLLTSARLATNTKTSQELNAAAASFAESLKDVTYVACAVDRRLRRCDRRCGSRRPIPTSSSTSSTSNTGIRRRRLRPRPTPPAPSPDQRCPTDHDRTHRARRRRQLSVVKRDPARRVPVSTMMPLVRPRRPERVTLVETLAVVAISSIIMIPLLGWGLVAIQEQEAVLDRNTDGASIGFLRTYFVRDVASAADAKIGTYAEEPTAPAERARAPGADAAPPGWRRRRVRRLQRGHVLGRRRAQHLAPGVRRYDARRRRPSSSIGSPRAPPPYLYRPGRSGPLPRTTAAESAFSLTTVDAETVAMTATVRAGKTVHQRSDRPGVRLTRRRTSSSSPTSVFRGDTVTFRRLGVVRPEGRHAVALLGLRRRHLSTDAVATHSYSALGEFAAVYTATDDDGTPASDFVRITVNNRLPTAVISRPSDRISTYAVCRRELRRQRLERRGDAPFGGTVVDYQWTYGDGTTSTQTSPAAHTHQFTSLSPGTAPFRRKSGSVEDNDGGLSPYDVANVTVTNRPPTTPSVTANSGPGPITGIVPRTVTFASTVSDPDICRRFRRGADLRVGLRRRGTPDRSQPHLHLHDGRAVHRPTDGHRHGRGIGDLQPDHRRSQHLAGGRVSP